MAFMAMAFATMLPILACGSFQPRPTPTPPQPVAGVAQGASAPVQSLPTSPPTPEPTPTATLPPTPAPTSTPSVQYPVSIGDQARVTNPGGINLREEPGLGAQVVTLLANGKRILIVGGPTSADEFIWWKVDDLQGHSGWLAGGQGTEHWISPDVGDARAVDRAPKVGDKVIVTLAGGLNVRTLPGLDQKVITRANANTQFTVIAGPQADDNYFWYQVRSDDGEIEGWAADGRDDERWLSPLE